MRIDSFTGEYADIYFVSILRLLSKIISCFRYNGSEIMLRDVQPRDEGDYSCQLNSIDHAIELVHHLDVLSKF